MILPQSCPICRQPLPPDAGTAGTTFPFCSVRCRNVDLLRWSNGEYAIVEQLDPTTVVELQAALGEESADY